MSRKKWELGKVNKDLAASIAGSLNIDPFAALLLSGREIPSIEEFVSSSCDLCDPFLLPDMQAAVDRINEAIFDFEPICVYGDYDCDGVTATALLYSYLEAQGANVTYMLPNRVTDGYGLSMAVVDRIAALGTKLIVTVDNGIAAVAEASYIKSLGMDLVVTDHHLPGDELPVCCAVVDPHLSNSSAPFSDYSGVGVAFKLCCAIEGDADPILYDFSYLVAIGTVADIVPLVGENRVLVKHGLASINSFMHPGVAALVDVCGFKSSVITSTEISFGLAPRINAAGRMESAEIALELLLCEEDEAACELAERLNSLNTARHAAEEEILSACTALVESDPDLVHKPVIVVSGEGWHEGVLGIVASKLLERYLRPVIVLSISGGVAKGSARSVEGFSIFDALSACKSHLTVFGGHAGAAGLTLDAGRIEAFSDAICEYAYSLSGLFYPTLRVDCKLNPDSLNLGLLDSISVLEPFGAENPSPQFGLFDMTIESITAVGNEKQHLRLGVFKEGRTAHVSMMMFGTSVSSFPYSVGDHVDFVVTLSLNSWNGEDRLSVLVKDLRPAFASDDLMVRSEHVFDKILLKHDLSEEEASFALPSRELVGRLYTYLKKNGGISNSYEYLYSKCGGELENPCMVRVGLVALFELKLISVDGSGVISVPSTASRVDLFSAPVLQFINGYVGESHG